MLSVIIPSYKDPLLHKTIGSLLDNSQGEIEIIPVLDGYWPDLPFRDDKRIKILHLGRNRGMREAINAGVAVAKGEYIMRTDEHCIFGEGFDLILTTNCKPNWIVTPRRFFLDVVKWEVMDNIPWVDYEKLVIQKVNDKVSKFAGRIWKSRAIERKDKMIDETMAMQGSCWMMPHKWWNDVIGTLQTEGYSQLYQDSHEMVFKTWKAGGKMVVNKATWFAHKHRSFPRTHNNGTPENPSNNEQCWAYALKVWRNYYEKEIKPKWGI